MTSNPTQFRLPENSILPGTVLLFLWVFLMGAPHHSFGQSFKNLKSPYEHNQPAESDSLCGNSFFKCFVIEGKSSAGYKILPAANGNFFIAASVEDKTMIVFTDSKLELIWAKSFDMAPGNDMINDLRLDSEGQLIGVGNVLGAVVECFAFKINAADGQVIWRSRLNDPLNSYFTRILEKNSSAENYFLFGQTDAANGGSGCDALLMEIDRNNGDLIWDKHYTLGSCELFSDAFIANNNIFACGRYNLLGGGQAGFRAALSMLDIDGDVQWSRHYLRNNSQTARLYANSMIPDGNNVMVLGYGSDNSTSLTATTIQLMKTSPTGALEWAKEYDIVGGDTERTYKLLNLPDGYLLTGHFNRPGLAGREAFLIKTDKAGGYLWGKSYGTDGEDTFRDVIVHADTLYLVGSTPNGSFSDILIGKLDLDGNVELTCNYIQNLEVTVSDYINALDDAHNLTPLSVAHNYATASLPTSVPETIASVAICQKICNDICDKPDAWITLDSIFCDSGALAIFLRIHNSGFAPYPANSWLSFYDADPTASSATLLRSMLIPFSVDTGNWLSVEIYDGHTFFPANATFDLFAVVNDDGSLIPPFSLDSFPRTGVEECDYSNNMDSYPISTASSINMVCPANITIAAAPGASTALVHFTDAMASTDCLCGDMEIELQQGLASGSDFPVGVTQVCWVASDICGATNSCCLTVTVQSTPLEDACDIKITPCVKFEILGISQNADAQKTYRMRVTNSCANKLIYTAFQLPNGITADNPANNTLYTAPSGRQYEVRNSNASPMHSIRFKAVGAGIASGQSDIFEYTLPPQAYPLFINAVARLSPNLMYETHLNVFDCVVQQIPNPPSEPVDERRVVDNIQPKSMMIFPNPASEVLYLQMPEGSNQSVKIRLLDSYGRPQFDQNVPSESNLIKLELPAELPAGFYFVEAVSTSGARYLARFVRTLKL